MAKQANGVVVYEGPSALDGAPIAVILTGLADGSNNVKTGAMVQSWIIRTDVEPHVALREGLDVSICGDCVHRSTASGGKGTCYVTVFQAPLSIFRAFHRGIYPRVSVGEAAALVSATGRAFRAGSYGDPAAAPIAWDTLCAAAPSWTGYTHQWRRPEFAHLAAVLMASCDNVGDVSDAWALGWATFRVAALGDGERMRGEARCPASREAGFKVTCATCPLRCAGATGSPVAGRGI